ncbi:hypothetical protein [Paraburkholderia unamae]|uniref:SMODS and SLOG-associating 2TM effector domain-containing protein n=2 Tax=Paraburkholderia unamae TaxID=219649 RepID=A0ABX5KQ51_9BURK|nr:hypothetical protein [Paraburkholderia unamae]PVX84382.1 hypothetical protein C7402_105223 [Paraburkholderia unamae]RAR59302.1 hypothetical protein C7401_111152 [Paraburkholderia unamae]CAG9247835.1 conserved hypothetical protein [Paraburkholderia unamae]
MGRENHPVWAVYDKLRTAHLNVRYYSERLRRLERWDMAMDVALVIAAPTSAVAGLWFFKTDMGKHVWQAFGTFAAFVAAIRPAIQFRRTLKAYETTISAYQALEYDLETIRRKIEQRGIYDEELKSDFLRALERQRHIDISSPDKIANSRLLKSCTTAVLTEMPASAFFVPET